MKTKTIYYFTFPVEHPFANYAVKIIAPTVSRAMGKMCQFFDKNWGFMHGPYSDEESQEMEFRKGKVCLGREFFNLTDRQLYG